MPRKNEFYDFGHVEGNHGFEDDDDVSDLEAYASTEEDVSFTEDENNYEHEPPSELP